MLTKLPERIAKSGINLLVIVVAIVVFVVAFVVMTTITNASKPATIDILAASRDLNYGDQVASADLVKMTVYEDRLASTYIPANQADKVVGGYVAVPIHLGQPITRDAIIAEAGIGTRLSAVLAKYPDYSLFPLPLDAPNVVAANSDSYVPGDLVTVTVVIASQPQPPETPTPAPTYSVSDLTITPTPEPATQSGDTTVEDALNRVYPPIAKDLFPQGVQVVAIQGLPVQPTPVSSTTSSNSNSTSNLSTVDYNLPKRLILLVPSKDIEELALGLKAGDMVIVSMVTAGQTDTTAGFSYWDLEDLLRLERQGVLK
jgi:hypothetical protein